MISKEDKREYEDDGCVIADMSDIELQPLLIPRPGRKAQSDAATRARAELDRESRRAMIGGALAAGLLVAGAIAIAFAALILAIGKM